MDVSKNLHTWNSLTRLHTNDFRGGGGSGGDGGGGNLSDLISI